MGTRQEAGILVVILALAVAALWDWPDGAKTPVHKAGAASEGRIESCPLFRPGMTGGRCVLLGMPIPINRAEAEHLVVVPGIGPVLARRMLEARRVRGAFGSLEELLQVKGIGPKRLQTLRQYLRVDEPRLQDPAP